MNIIEVAQKSDEIAHRQDVYCPLCQSRQYAVFDKLYTVAYEKCIVCSTPEELDKKSGNIFAMI